MEVEDNEAGGQTVVLEDGDRLRDVPRSHRGLITNSVRVVFENVPGYFTRMAEKTPFVQMAEWLRALLKENRWSLKLHASYPVDPMEEECAIGRASFGWSSEEVYGVEIGPPRSEHLWTLPKSLTLLYGLIGFVNWSGYGCGGGEISEPDGFLFEPGVNPDWSPRVNWASTLTWGGFNGAFMFATADDRGGWISSGDEETTVVGGSVAETVNWWFGQLLSGTSPTYEEFKEDYWHNSYWCWRKRSAS